MLDWFLTLIGKKKVEEVVEATSSSFGVATPSVMGLGLGQAFELDTLNLKLLESQIIMEDATPTQFIQAVGKVELDDTTTILRFYTDDDGFVQVVLEGGDTEEFVTDVKLFYFYNTEGVSKQSSWDSLLESDVSKPVYELEGNKYERVWTDVSGNIPPVAMSEKTYADDGSISTTDQFVMLYDRPVGEDNAECVLVSAEEKIVDNSHDRCLVISTGINLSRSDITIIGE